MTKEDILNVNKEYEKLVPPVKREMLFDESEDYNSFRNYIINQPQEAYSKKKLPFNEVVLLSYSYYKKNEVIDNARANGKRVFFIKQSIKGMADFCDAAGYYSYSTKKFVLLPFSFIVSKSRDLFTKVDTRADTPDGVNLYTLSVKVFDSPEDAASYVLGQRAGYNEWVDVKGNGLDVYYKRFAELASQQLVRQECKEMQNKPLKDLPSETTKTNDMYNELSTIIHSKNITQSVKHNTLPLFHIQIDDGNDTIHTAYGIYDAVTGSFILKAGSYMLEKVSSLYKYTADEMKRRIFIKKYCTKESVFFRIERDCNFMTPGQAASCVLGRVVDGWNEWKDETGKSLREFC